MITQYHITGMTCMGCVSSVQKKLEAIDGVSGVLVNLSPGGASVMSEQALSVDMLQRVLGEKYTVLPALQEDPSKESLAPVQEASSKPAWKQLTPLYLIFAFIGGGVFLSHLEGFMSGSFNTVFSEAMLDFMALFYLVFSFFKLLDLKGFPDSFAMYDPVAKRSRLYAQLYPFVELSLGMLLLMRWYVPAVLVITLVILGLTTVGVVRSLLSKKQIQCACLGTALKLPMTQATFIENALMISMAVYMLLSLF